MRNGYKLVHPPYRVSAAAAVRSAAQRVHHAAAAARPGVFADAAADAAAGPGASEPLPLARLREERGSVDGGR
jgi:hypothetical protein